MEFPEDLRYNREHTWLRVEGDQGRVGITDYAQDQLGDVVFVELPEVGTEVKQLEPFGVIESSKATSDLYSPVSGEVVEINDVLDDEPELVNRGPYGEGWMIVIRMSDQAELDNLISAQEYEAFIKEGSGD